MINTLYLPELREMLAENNTVELREFCEAIHPARAAEFMSGLSSNEAWRVISATQVELRGEIFFYFGKDKQFEILENEPLESVAEMVAEMAPDDRVDLLQELDEDRRESLLRLCLSKNVVTSSV